MPKGFYVDIVRGSKVGLLAGPFASEPEARAWLDRARSLAMDVDAWAAFDLFGTVGIEREVLPVGTLNTRLGVPVA